METYIEQRCAGGAGVFVVGETNVPDAAESGADAWGAGISSVALLEAYSRIAAIAKRHDTIVIDQLSHYGGQTWQVPGVAAWAPSSVPHPISGVVPAAMTVEHLAKLRELYVQGARWAEEGGLDGVEIKCDQGKLLHQFLSARYNRRHDKYGGSQASRNTFPLELLEAVRTSLQRSRTLVGVRVSVDRFNDDALDKSVAAAIEFAVLIEQRGLADYITVSGATNSDYLGYAAAHGDGDSPPARFRQYSAAIKQAIRLPVVLTGGISNLRVAEDVLNAGDADMIGMTRAFIADHRIGTLLASHREEEIRPCIRCNQGCVGNTWEGRRLRCTVNPIVGRERELATTNHYQKARRILVAGAGIAGLEFSINAAAAGHHVTLMEATDRIGGQLVFAARMAGRQSLSDLIHYYERMMSKSTVDAHFECPVNAAIAAGASWDDIVLAIGSTPTPSALPQGSGVVLNPIDATQKQHLERMTSVLVVAEDWLQQPLAIALSVAEHANRVAVITTREFVGWGLDVVSLTNYYAALRRRGISMTSLTAFEGFDSAGAVLLRDLTTNALEPRPDIDTVVQVANNVPRSPPLESFGSIAGSVHLIGDCVFPRGLEYAMVDAHKLLKRLHTQRTLP